MYFFFTFSLRSFVCPRPLSSLPFPTIGCERLPQSDALVCMSSYTKKKRKTNMRRSIVESERWEHDLCVT